MNRTCPVCGLRNTALVSFGPAGLAYWIQCADCGTAFRVASHRTKKPNPSGLKIIAWILFVFVLVIGIAILAAHFLGRTTLPYHRSALVLWFPWVYAKIKTRE
jgi:hypothetical protein